MWVPLHQHSQYSILDSTCTVEGIAQRAAAMKMPACALTDHGNMHGAIDFYKACQSHGVKPIIGCEVYVAPESRLDKKKVNGRSAYHLTLLAKNLEGYHNLCRLSSKGFLEGFYYHPRIDKALLKEHAQGLICLSGCLSSQISQAALLESDALFWEEVEWHQSLFGEDFYLELQRHLMKDQEIEAFAETWLKQRYYEFSDAQKRVNDKLLEAASKKKILYIATNDTHYFDPEDWQAHEILLNIQSGEAVEIWEKDAQGNPQFRIPNPKRRTYPTRCSYFKSPEEMQELFHDVPEAVSNTLRVAEKCTLHLDFETKHYPVYIPPGLEGKPFSKQEQAKAAEAYLRQLCEEGISSRYNEEALAKVAEKHPGKDPKQVVRDRLDWELEIITSKGMCDYLLIVWDFINWAKQQGIPVGPGRGSGASSIILYLIGVTDIEPLRFGLFFERFINPERISYPDIDVDICMARRSEVIDYTVKKYGKENVAQIITFGTMKAKMALKDVGRVLSVPLSKVNAIAKLIPEDLNMSLDRALEIDADLLRTYQEDPEARRLIDQGKKLEGSIRNLSIHAAGMIICGDPLTDHIPVCLAKDSEMAATQYSMKPVEKVGMLKIDILGLKTLTSIQIAVDAVRQHTGLEIDWVNLPLDDLPSFQLLHQGRTLGIFQMESGGMQELARQLQPDRFEEIIAIGALYRPGPMDMIPSFINRKHGKEAIEYDHPVMESILSETYGIMVYQEQVMEIARQLANYSLGEGDVLRRAMGKKDKLQMEKEREKFRKGALENGVPDEVAMAIFDKMEKFAAYGFNKPHAASYGYLTYVTAYLKAHHPKEWMAALMTCDQDDVSKVAKFIRECQAMGISILPPDINEAGKEFVATDKGIRFAMTAIKGVGEGVVNAIVEEREKNGAFEHFYHFFRRIAIKRVGKKVVECLVDAGCFDYTGWSRDALRQSIEQMHEVAAADQREAANGVMTLFSLIGDTGEKRFEMPPEVHHPTPQIDVFKREKELMGFFLTGHPMDGYQQIMQRLSCLPLCQFESMEHQALGRSAFIIESVQTRLSTRTQKKFAILMISDGLESYELPIWPDLYEEKGGLLKENQLIYAVLQVDKREESMRLICRWLDDLTSVNEEMIAACDHAYDRAKHHASFTTKRHNVKKAVPAFCLHIDAEKIRLSHILQLKEILGMHPGPHPIEISFYGGEKCLGRLYTHERWKVAPSAQLTALLEAIPGLTCIEQLQ